MRLGVWTPLPHTIRTEPLMARAIAELKTPGGDGPDLSYKFALDVLTRAERYGFDISLIAERFLGPDLEAWMLATALAANTKRIQIMPAVHPGMFTPQVVAKMAASLDRISGGRVALNLVNGWWEDEFTNYSNGGWLDGSAARYRRMDEFIQVMKGLWTQEEFSFPGEFYQVKNGRLPTRSMRQPYPPLYAASRAEEGKDIIARECDMWFVSYNAGYRNYEDNVALIDREATAMRARAAQHGRTIGLGLNPQVLIADTLAEANAQADDFEIFGKRDNVSRLSASALGAGLVGTPELIAERIDRYESMGVDLLMLRFYPMIDGLEAFATRVLPLLNRRQAEAAE